MSHVCIVLYCICAFARAVRTLSDSLQCYLKEVLSLTRLMNEHLTRGSATSPVRKSLVRAAPTRGQQFCTSPNGSSPEHLFQNTRLGKNATWSVDRGGSSPKRATEPHTRPCLLSHSTGHREKLNQRGRSPLST